jgi:hypothetical protein
MGHTVELAIPFPSPDVENREHFGLLPESAEAENRPYDSYGALPPVA